MIDDMANHLWQSTLAAGAAGMLAIAFRRHRANVRYWIWVGASLKFLVPFALFMALGSELELRPAVQRMTSPEVSSAVVQVNQPFGSWSSPRPELPSDRATWTELGIVGLWLGGVLTVASIRLRLWRRVRAVTRSSLAWSIPAGVTLEAPVDVRSARSVIEPCVVGWWRPILIVPADIERDLTGPQLEAVLAHELCHVRRRDNLTAAIHMVVEALFWFHPLVWWIGARMVKERERACDEAVLSSFAEPQAYAEGILNVCKRYVEVPLVCVSGVSGSDLRARIEAIMARKIGFGLHVGGKVALLVAVLTAITFPVIVGALDPSSQTAARPGDDTPRFDVASIRVNREISDRPTLIRPTLQPGGRLLMRNQTLRDLILTAYGVGENELIGGPAWIGSTGFDLEARGPADLSRETARAMLRTLLADRFSLLVHREQRELPIYVLTMAARDRRPGPQLRSAAAECVDVTRPKGWPREPPPSEVPVQPPPLGHAGPPPRCRSIFTGGHFSGRAVSMDVLAGELAEATARPVVNRTDLTGEFNLDLRYTPDLDALTSADAAVPPGLTTALQEQLGLKLEAARGLVEVLVVDRALMPTEN